MYWRSCSQSFRLAHPIQIQTLPYPTYNPFVPLSATPNANETATPAPTRTPGPTPTRAALSVTLPPTRDPNSPMTTPTADAPHALPTLRQNAAQYTVQTGDTLGDIAQKYGISVERAGTSQWNQRSEFACRWANAQCAATRSGSGRIVVQDHSRFRIGLWPGQRAVRCGGVHPKSGRISFELFGSRQRSDLARHQRENIDRRADHHCKWRRIIRSTRGFCWR